MSYCMTHHWTLRFHVLLHESLSKRVWSLHMTLVCWHALIGFQSSSAFFVGLEIFKTCWRAVSSIFRNAWLLLVCSSVWRLFIPSWMLLLRYSIINLYHLWLCCLKICLSCSNESNFFLENLWSIFRWCVPALIFAIFHSHLLNNLHWYFKHIPLKYYCKFFSAFFM